MLMVSSVSVYPIIIELQLQKLISTKLSRVMHKDCTELRLMHIHVHGHVH